MGWVGLEPTTNALKGHCSTIELPTRHSEPWFPAACLQQGSDCLRQCAVGGKEKCDQNFPRAQFACSTGAWRENPRPE